MISPHPPPALATDATGDEVQLRDNVLAIVAHDLRTPLSAISMAADLLTSADSVAARASYLSMIKQAVDQAEHLIRDLVDVAQIERGQLSIDSRPEPLDYLLDSVSAMFIPQADAAGLILACDSSAVRGVKVRVDYARFAQLLSNLITNAIKFTPPGGSILLSASRNDEWARVTVRDSGVGISADEMPHVFERFWQANHHRRAGAGLGLAIARGIAEAHGGEIGVLRTDHFGSTFYFTLPLSA